MNPRLCPTCGCEPTGTTPDGLYLCDYCDPRREAAEREEESLFATEVYAFPLSSVDLFPPIHLAA